jgi:hypothetical protein
MKTMNIEKSNLKKLMDSVDSFLMSQTSRLFMNAVERYVVEYMNTKRAVFWFCDSARSELYKIDTVDGRDGISQ